MATDTKQHVVEPASDTETEHVPKRGFAFDARKKFGAFLLGKASQDSFTKLIQSTAFNTSGVGQVPLECQECLYTTEYGYQTHVRSRSMYITSISTKLDIYGKSLLMGLNNYAKQQWILANLKTGPFELVATCHSPQGMQEKKTFLHNSIFSVGRFPHTDGYPVVHVEAEGIPDVFLSPEKDATKQFYPCSRFHALGIVVCAPQKTDTLFCVLFDVFSMTGTHVWTDHKTQSQKKKNKNNHSVTTTMNQAASSFGEDHLIMNDRGVPCEPSGDTKHNLIVLKLTAKLESSHMVTFGLRDNGGTGITFHLEKRK
jgi:hypothetical protein